MPHARLLRSARLCSFLAPLALALLLGGCSGAAHETGSGGSGGESTSGAGGSTSSSATGSVGSTGSGGSTGGTTSSGSTSTTSATSTGSTTGTGSTADAGTSLDPTVSPGGNFDLSGWQLQLPIGSTGSPTMIPGSQLAGPNGFTDTYFYTDKTDGAMSLMDPPTGVTTSGSMHPRSELREVTSGWSTAGTNTQTVTLAVPQVQGTTTIGQIFQSPPAPSKPLMELQYVSGGKVQLLLEKTNQGGSSNTYPIGSVTDGSTFTYELSLTGTTISITLNGAAQTFTMPSSFEGESFYFKVGDYDQTAVVGTPGTMPGTIVKVYALKVVHQ